MKLYIIGKNQIIRIAGVIVSLAVVIGTVTVLASDPGKRLPIYCVETDKKQVALTFDAAWGNEDTETLINELKEYKAKATFFCVAQWVERYPESVKQLYDAGHSVQNHSSTHPKMSGIGESEQIKEITKCNQMIKDITGVKPTLFRAPYGDYNNELIGTVESQKMFTIQWDVDSLDWQETSTAESIADRVISKAKNGSIILMHNDAKFTPKALPVILKALSQKGYEFVFVEDLIYKKDYTIDNCGMQIYEGK